MKKIFMLLAVLAGMFTVAQGQDVKETPRETGPQATRTINAAEDKIDRETRQAQQDVQAEMREVKAKAQPVSSKVSRKTERKLRKSARKAARKSAPNRG